MKRAGVQRPVAGFRPIHMPRNTGAGIILSGISLVCGFALIWYIWWLAVASFAALLFTAIAHTFNYRRDYHIPVETVEATEAARTRELAMAGGAA
jgi:cytochrome o ubiquinol oxidase subunit 1